jgi:hypothetical protein
VSFLNQFNFNLISCHFIHDANLLLCLKEKQKAFRVCQNLKFPEIKQLCYLKLAGKNGRWACCAEGRRDAALDADMRPRRPPWTSETVGSWCQRPASCAASDDHRDSVAHIVWSFFLNY